MSTPDTTAAVVDETRGQMRRSVVIYLARAALSLVLFLVLGPWLVARVGAERFGLFAAAAVVCGALPHLDFGLSFALNRASAMEHAAGRSGTARTLALAGSLAIGAGWCALCALFAACAGPALARAADGGAWLGLAVAASLAGFLTVPPHACLSGVMRADQAAGAVALAQLAIWPLAAALATAGFGLTALFGAQLAVNLFSLSACWLALARATRDRPGGPLPGGLVADCVGALPMRIYAFAFYGSDKAVLMALSLAPVAAAYELAAKPAEGLRLMFWYWTAPLLAGASSLSGAEGPEQAAALARLASVALRPICYLGMPAAALVACASPALTALWLDRADPHLTLAIAGLFLAYIGNALTFPLWSLLAGHGITRALSLLFLASTALHPLVAYAAGSAYGPAGVVGGFVVLVWTTGLILLAYFHARFRAPEALAHVRHGAALAALAALGWLSLGGTWAPPADRLSALMRLLPAIPPALAVLTAAAMVLRKAPGVHFTPGS